MEDNETKVLVSKLSVLFLFGFLKFISGYAPSLILRRLNVHGRRRKYLEIGMSGVLCFGGGVLFATVFIHMVPEVRESLNTGIKQLLEVIAK